MRQSVTYKEKSDGFANQTFRLLLVGRSRSGFSSPDSDTYYTLGLAVETIAESSMLSPDWWLRLVGIYVGLTFTEKPALQRKLPQVGSATEGTSD